jgi:hypothetical protein
MDPEVVLTSEKLTYLDLESAKSSNRNRFDPRELIGAGNAQVFSAKLFCDFVVVEFAKRLGAELLY